MWPHRILIWTTWTRKSWNNRATIDSKWSGARRNGSGGTDVGCWWSKEEGWRRRRDEHSSWLSLLSHMCHIKWSTIQVNSWETQTHAVFIPHVHTLQLTHTHTTALEFMGMSNSLHSLNLHAIDIGPHTGKLLWAKGDYLHKVLLLLDPNVLTVE